MKAEHMFPETPGAAAALSVATHFYSPALLNHTVRSYLWGAPLQTAIDRHAGGLIPWKQ